MDNSYLDQFKHIGDTEQDYWGAKVEDYRAGIVDRFDDPDVKEDETITSYYKQSWLDALEDYKPDEVPQ